VSSWQLPFAPQSSLLQLTSHLPFASLSCSPLLQTQIASPELSSHFEPASQSV